MLGKGNLVAHAGVERRSTVEAYHRDLVIYPTRLMPTQYLTEVRKLETDVCCARNAQWDRDRGREDRLKWQRRRRNVGGARERQLVGFEMFDQRAKDLGAVVCELVGAERCIVIDEIERECA